MTYAIDKNIPIPTSSQGTATDTKYPFLDMQVGDSFALPVDPNTNLNFICVARRLSNAVYIHSKRYKNGTKFTVRTDRFKKEIRVWRSA